MDKQTVLIVEDDPQMVGVISYAFQVAEFETLIAFNAHQALDHMKNYRVHLVVLDVMLPGQSGLELCRQIRSNLDVPILMLTAKSDQADVIEGLEHGADDYMAKPFSTRELLLRAKAILRRTRHKPDLVEAGPLKIDMSSHIVTLHDRSVELSPLSYRLLAYLLKNQQKVVSTHELIEHVWELESQAGGPEMVKVEVYRLRQKIEPNPKKPRFIRTVRGVGYQFTVGE
ncbi:MAG: response regulator transcription factor [Chloroflexota bacterium]